MATPQHKALMKANNIRLKMKKIKAKITELDEFEKDCYNSHMGVQDRYMEDYSMSGKGMRRQLNRIDDAREKAIIKGFKLKNHYRKLDKQLNELNQQYGLNVKVDDEEDDTARSNNANK